MVCAWDNTRNNANYPTGFVRTNGPGYTEACSDQSATNIICASPGAGQYLCAAGDQLRWTCPICFRCDSSPRLGCVRVFVEAKASGLDLLSPRCNFYDS